ncbi:hypothetical protein IMZ11_02800 [Microtetraspora sp. AC03309]|uniref:hypothetical protein n=1 Tax=Microtetraspora sp. AC03309 TaxID=2779376 RepID=UPI001E60824D|nr:hypothetical protein [Microtetraspora sp. AC03309]MCC5574569.1 hypothetical protein [Microtetraspora sp. AC03309]
MSRQDIAERFQRETAKHTMTVRHDEGLYRHLRFRDPKHGMYWFDLITVPHALIFRGDGESFVFDRMDDMFEFFRSGIWRDGSVHINPGYWAEKLTSDRDSVKKYDQGLFEQTVKEHVAEAILDRSAPRGISRAIKELFEYGDITWEGGARRALEEFEYCTFKASCLCGAEETFTDEIDADLWGHRHVRATDITHRISVKRGESFSFEDTSEWSFRDYDWWFLWALHGIVWGITQYDAAKRADAEQAEAVAG